MVSEPESAPHRVSRLRFLFDGRSALRRARARNGDNPFQQGSECHE